MQGIQFVINSEIHMWVVMALSLLAVISYAYERISLEMTSISILIVLLLFGQFFPLNDPNGYNLLGTKDLLAGFANPSLIAVMALLVMGQGIIQTDALGGLARLLKVESKLLARVYLILILLFVCVMSAFMNNTPLVVLAIPIIQSLVSSMGVSESRVMMPLSFVAILGGMMTLIGSSTNLLVSSSLQELGYEPLKFFEFAIPGIYLAAVGLIYVIGISPFLLPDRSRLSRQFVNDEKEFIAEIDVPENSNLIGQKCVEGSFPILKDLKIKLIQRAGNLVLPPFEDHEINTGDIIIVSATRSALMEALSKHPGYFLSDDQVRELDGDIKKKGKESDENKDSKTEGDGLETRMLAEIMVPPGSRLIDMSLERSGLELQYKTIILGIQRRARVVRRRLGRIRLEAGDVLLVAGSQENINMMRKSSDLIVLSGSKKDIPQKSKAELSIYIFLSMVALSAMNIISIPVAGLTGATLMLASGCLNIRQAGRALDRRIYLLVGSMLALGTALQNTGGARFLADLVMQLPLADQPLFLACMLFIMVAFATNILTNNACAILFTPIAINMAVASNIDPYIFAITVIFGANCSFASPIGYQTNLLIMGPGHYKFRDFMKAGIPLILILWVTFFFIAKYYYGL